MRAQEFLLESKTASADAVWNYVKQIHPDDQQGGGFLEQLIRQYPKYQLQTVPLSGLIIHDQESDDPDQEPEEDPYGRVQVVDPEYAGEISIHNIDRNPIVIDRDGHILDGNHRAWAAAELLGRDTIQAWVPVEQELDEIERAEPGLYTGGKEDLPVTVDTKNMPRIRPLPGGSRFGYYVVDGTVIYIVDPKKPREQREQPRDIIVAKLHLERAGGGLAQVLPNLYQVETITVDEHYRRQGLARSLYGIALTILKYTLMAGSIQTTGGRRMWQMLHTIPGVEMFGVVDDYIINDKIAQAILKRGGRVIHQAPSKEIPGETDRVYAFPIRAGSNEIVSQIRGLRVYDEMDDNGVSLIAKWTGR